MRKTVVNIHNCIGLKLATWILTTLCLVSQVHPLTLTVTPSLKTINSITTYDWNLTSLTPPTTSLTLQFPSITTLNSSSPSLVLTSTNIPYPGTLSFSGNNITIQIPTGQQANGSLFFRVSYVRNPGYQFSQNARVYVGVGGAGGTASYFVSFQKGVVLDCVLSFLGVTDAAVSTAYLDFRTTNPITNNRTLFKIYYSSYTLLTTKITQNNNLTCSYSLNSSPFSSEVPATYPSPGSPIFDCSFSNLNLPANSTIRLRFSNVRNPPYKNNYLIDPFRVETMDGVYFYDAAAGCSLGDVAVDTYDAAFTQTSKLINTVYYNPRIETTLQISKNFASNDRILIQHPTLQIPTLGSSILLSRISSSYPAIQFNLLSGSSNTTLITQSSVGNAIQQTKRLAIEMLNFGILLPSSMSPVNLLFRFMRNYAANSSVALEFLNVGVVVRGVAVGFDIGDLVVTPLYNQIGVKSPYTFRVNISQPLSPTSYILLNLPLQLSLTQFLPTSTCLLQSTTPSTTPTCSIHNSANKILKVSITSTTTITAPQILNITIGDIVNADNPERDFVFGVQTYYMEGDGLSKVEVGAGLVGVRYGWREMSVVAERPTPGYTVDYFPSILTLTYTPGIKIPSNLLIIFTFLPSLTVINYKNVTVNGSPYVYTKSQSGQIINLTVSNQIPMGATVVFKFQFKAPASVDTYQAVTVEVRAAGGTLYEKSLSNLSIQVSFPASEVFSMTPVSSITGALTNYTLSFFTNVIHPSTFYLSIKFPTDIKILNMTAVRCFPTSTCKGIIPISSSTPQQILLNLTSSLTTNTYSITITNITNSRQIGTTGTFNLATLTNYTNGNLILTGSVTTTIAYPNTATASFDMSQYYYRDNTRPVSMLASFWNDLGVGDFIRVRFDYRTYVVGLGGISAIRCSNGVICTYDAAQSTSFSTVIKVIPNRLTQPISFSIQGLNSSATTFPNQKFQILLRSYTSTDIQMDQTKLIYNISCSNTTTILNKTCKTCNEQTQICYSCYSGYYLFNNSICVTDCSSSSQYRAYTGSDVCVSCVNNCSKCISATLCLTCVGGFYLYQNSTCKTQCNTENGYYITTAATSGQLMCVRCWSQSCLKCTDGGSNSCLNCGTAYMDPSNPGRCVDSCDLTSNYQSGADCLPCNSRCIGCTGGTISDCIICRPGYYNVSNSCQASCPQYTVPMPDRTCSCSGRCDKCQLVDTRCITCKNTSNLLYNYQCLQGCPNSSYEYYGKCIDCNQGCLTCTVNACLQCLPGYNVYQNKCFTQCNSVGERFSAVNGTCIQCPVGCDLCNGALECSVCLGNYTLVGTVCQKTCQLQKNCEKVSPVPDKILPLPGLIAGCAWLAILIVLKIFFLNKIYLPYAYIFLSCLIQIFIGIAVLVKMQTKIQTLILNSQSTRLLQTVTTTTDQTPQPYQYAVMGILATTIALNFVSNFVYLFLFCKYLKKYIPDRQIDKISNYLVVTVGTLSNFRFSLLAYSKLFPKPNILVENQSKLTPLHYMCIASIFTSFLPLSASCILIYNQYPLTDLFMLGIDLLIIVIISLIFTIWMVSVDKPQQYFQGTKKYTKQEINNTTQNLNQKQNVNQSKHKLNMNSVYNNNLDNSIIQVEDLNEEIDQKSVRNGVGGYGVGNSNRNGNGNVNVNGNSQVSGQANAKNNKNIKNVKSDNQNQRLPSIPIRVSNVNIETMKVKARDEREEESGQFDSDSLQDQKRKIDHSFSERKTQRYKNSKTDMKKYGNQSKAHANVDAEHEKPIEGGIKSRNKESTKNFSKQKRVNKKKEKGSEDLNIKINQISGKNDGNNDSQYIDESLDIHDLSINKARSDILYKQKKPLKSQRSSGILPITMKKKQSFGMFESEKAASQIDEVDFESLIQTKMIDKTKQKRQTTSAVKLEEPQHQEISPSWFNQQNQRFDFDSSSDGV